MFIVDTCLKLLALCNANNITYTRYVDDLTFSAQQDFKYLLNEILDIVTSGDFKLSYRKTQYKGNQIVTGVNIFPNKIDAPEKIKQKADLEKELKSVTKPYTNYLNNIRKTNNKKPDNQRPIGLQKNK